MAERKIWKEQNLTCKPLDSLEEISEFLQDPPSWRSLCVELKPHSEYVVKNTDVNKFFGKNILETPQTFCHYEPETEEVERHKRKDLPKTLVCHDMANGYHDDSVIDGTGNYSAYTFYNWGAIDIFCYFSHHFITIPPLGWINVGHAHGVKVIGTVITEWADGAALWDKILQSDEEWRHFASALVAIAKTLRFDGWLLNIENKVSKPATLLQFVQHFHQLLHQELEEPLLVWYDSVTHEGDLSWQNALNDKNKRFFDAVDGFFSNYSWSPQQVEDSVSAAAHRRTDLFVGVDVWGRNFYGGGQLNTQQAIQIAFDYGCSLAIFAPAWTHEALSQDPTDINSVANSEDLEHYERFLLRDRAFWGSLWPYLNTKLPRGLPFQTSFCRGQGKKRRMYGEVVCPVSWYNLNHMQYQPNSSHGPHGYLISTHDTIINITQSGLLNEANIYRYRRSLEKNRIELALDDKDSNDCTTEPIEEVDGERPTVKRKMKDNIRRLFNSKTAKSEPKRLDISGEAPENSGRSSKQPVKTQYALAYVPNELECLEPFYGDSFLGGCCLKVNPSDVTNPRHRLSRILFCDFEFRTSIIACIITKTLIGYEDQFLNIILNVQGKFKKVVLVGSSQEVESDGNAINVYPLNEGSDSGFRELQTYLVLHEPDFYVPVANAYGWKVRYYEVSMREVGVGVGVGERAHVTSVSCRTANSVGPILLGYFGLCSRKHTDIQI